ncbi:MAG: phosphohydrolase [Sphingobacteriales bacterium 17-39-43]|uniref:HD domain-containing protein n=1 Tax=Daejeonella sp. TaxID=2805397 RepID=UPI000BD7E259|nr:HD domain-containing protein [Daejeonella sp.]OYZ32273.1 MAG: phosphohydrolase [Sphingobacteriales bacterium 16-39-50]OZA25617.1 MAG: phosphohydrolase [Sphingobacteriales bacterium 17-39-43]HQT22101.1 HD domain-containing protein [Daejeonella sp.]HQT57408.1 HD domain-containing protein [Daejeonella sp.]
MNKKKIINDPVYGFITIPSELVYDLIQHPYVQRLRYIKQLGMTHLVYPGALHTRFHHALGAMHLMSLAIETIKSKGQAISYEEEEAVMIAILLHDIGHGPFSHALEHTIVDGVSHEHITALLMNNLNREFDGKLTMALEIFNNRYPKTFLHQLVSGQLDIDRLDYLNRDSFFTGVSEGVISFDRIIKMLDVIDDQLVVEEKGIYSIEKFLIARRLMYWQVYLHKTVIAAEQMLVKILERAKELSFEGRNLFSSPCFSYFLKNSVSREEFRNDPRNLERFTKLDDNDIFTSIKVWADDEDLILSTLCKHLISRNLYKVEISNEPPPVEWINELADRVTDEFEVSDDETSYFVFTDTIKNNAYHVGDGSINILMKNGSIQDITKASDNSNLEALAKTVQKYILCYVKEIRDVN